MYGATPLEDIIGYNQIVRSLTEWTGNAPDGVLTQSSIHEGIGSYSNGMSGHISTDAALTSGVADSSALPGLVNTRQAYIQGVSTIIDPTQATYPAPPRGMGFGVVPAGTLAVSPAITGAGTADLILTTNPVRRYQVQFALGLFTQNKLIPTKFMASQLAIEITLANAAECIFAPVAANSPSYQITNVNLIPEILEFDASYDEMFLRGLMDRGVPIKFSTWNNYKFGVTGSTANLQIQERSRSVKAIFALQRRDPVSFTTDSGASFFNTATNVADGAISLQEYQYRIGGR
jgi:hypothetical protein